MNSYRINFKNYLEDLAKKKPSPGGGSTVCLVFCSGISLIEKAINYSTQSDNNKLKRQLKEFRNLRKLVYPCIDKDGYIFGRIMASRGKRREEFVGKSNQVVAKVGLSCLKAFSLAKGIESDIKSSIISDFRIGLEFIRSALFGCVLNLEANQKIFGKKSKYIVKFKKILSQWR